MIDCNPAEISAAEVASELSSPTFATRRARETRRMCLSTADSRGYWAPSCADEATNSVEQCAVKFCAFRRSKATPDLIRYGVRLDCCEAIDSFGAGCKSPCVPARLTGEPGAQYADIGRKSAEYLVRRWAEKKDSGDADGCCDVPQAAVVRHHGARRREDASGFLQRQQPDSERTWAGKRMGAPSKWRRSSSTPTTTTSSNRSASSGKCGHRFAAITPVLQPGASTSVPAVCHAPDPARPAGSRTAAATPHNRPAARSPGSKPVRFDRRGDPGGAPPCWGWRGNVPRSGSSRTAGWRESGCRRIAPAPRPPCRRKGCAARSILRTAPRCQIIAVDRKIEPKPCRASASSIGVARTILPTPDAR